MHERGGIKQLALASALGVDESSISRWKANGQISLGNAISLCRELDISLDWFLTGEGAMERDNGRLDADPDSQLWAALQRARSKLSPESHNLLIKLIESFE